MKRVLIATLACVAFSTASARDASQQSVDGSATFSGVVVAGSLLPAVIGASIVVESVTRTGEVLEVVVKGVANGSKATIHLSGEMARTVSVAAGETLDVSITASGYILVASGKALAFIPNEAGKALLHHSRVL